MLSKLTKWQVNMYNELERLKELHLAEQLGRLHRLWRTAADVELIPLALEIELSSLMRTLGQLEAQGYIKRRCCENDKRARIVSLTPQGIDILKQIETRIMQIRAELLNGISSQELSEFERVISLISDNAMAKLDPSADPFGEK
jgi:MarR family transcriptional regulator for hemolysin